MLEGPESGAGYILQLLHIEYERIILGCYINPANPDESPYGSPIVNSYCHAWSCTPAYFLRGGAKER